MVSCRECRKTLQGQYVKLKGDDFCKEDCAARYHGKSARTAINMLSTMV